MSCTGVDGSGGRADRTGEPTEAGQPGTGCGERGSHRVAGAGSGRAVGRGGLLELP